MGGRGTDVDDDTLERDTHDTDTNKLTRQSTGTVSEYHS